MADFDAFIYGIEVGIGGTANEDVYQRSMMRMTHSQFIQTPLSRDSINTYNYLMSHASEDIVAQGDIEPYE